MGPVETYSSDVAFTPSVKAVQVKKGSREHFRRMEERGAWQTKITPDLARFIAAQTSAFLATANIAGQPYIQHRGGPPGFLHVLDEKTIGFVDFESASWMATPTIFLIREFSRHRRPAAGPLQDRDGVHWVLDRRTRRLFPFIERIFGDAGYQGPKTAAVIAKSGTWKLEIVKRSELHRFVVLPKRWIVERTLAWISHNRRLARDFERYARSAAAFIRLAMIRIMLRRLTRPAHCS